jgi:hypothetical protein
MQKNEFNQIYIFLEYEDWIKKAEDRMKQINFTSTVMSHKISYDHENY